MIWPGGNWLQHFVERWPLGHSKDQRKMGKALTGSGLSQQTPPWPAEREEVKRNITHLKDWPELWSSAECVWIYRQVVAAVAADQLWLVVDVHLVSFSLQTSDTQHLKPLQQPAPLLVWQRACNTTSPQKHCNSSVLKSTCSWKPQTETETILVESNTLWKD